MSIFDRFRRNEDPKRESPLQPEQEIVPEHSPETLEKIGQLDGKIAESEHLLGGLGRMAREKILTDPEAFEEIYAPKEIGRVKVGREDAWAFEPAGRVLRVKNSLLRILGGGGSDYVLENGKELVDKRRLKPEVKKRIEQGERLRLSPDELAEAAEKLDLNPEETKPEDFSMKYAEGKNGVEQVILGKKTEQEMDETAADILQRRLEELEKNGAGLIGEKQGLERFEKEVESAKSAFEGEDLAKLEGEKQERNQIINSKQQELSSGLEVIRQPLLEQQKGLNEALAGFSPLLADALVQENGFKTKIAELQDKMNKISRTQEVSKSPVAVERMRQLEEQRAQAEVNQKDFRAKKEALNMRMAEFKRIQAEVDRMLARINNIGKTKEELKAEAAETAKQERAKKEKKPVEPEKQTSPQPTGKARRIKIEFPGKDASKETAEPGDSDDSDWVDDAAKQQERKAEKQQTIDEEIHTTNWRDARKRPSAGQRTEKPVLSTAGTTVPEQRVEQSQTPEKRGERMPVRYWLNEIFKIVLEDKADKAVKRHFKVGYLFSPTTPMTLNQARKAYINYLSDFKQMKPSAAAARAGRDFKRMFGTEGDISVVAESAMGKSADASKLAGTTPEAGSEKSEAKGGVEAKAAETSTPEPSDHAKEETKNGQEEIKPSAKELINAINANNGKGWAKREKELKVEAGAGPKPDSRRAAKPVAEKPAETTTEAGSKKPEKEEIKFKTKELLVKLDLKSTRAIERKARKKHFASSEMTESQAVEAYLGYLNDINGKSGVVPRARVEELIRKAIS